MSLRRSSSTIQPFLDEVFHAYHRTEHLGSDPLEFVHRFSDPWDQEVVALVAAQLAYGNVRQIRSSVQLWLDGVIKSSGTPSNFVREGLLDESVRAKLSGFVHRIHRGDDLLFLLDLLAESWRRYGSLGAHLATRLAPGAPDFSEALDALLADWKSWVQEKTGAKPSRSLAHFLAAPASGSCCKRWCMLLRWMGRRDDLDPGLWQPGSVLLQNLPAGAGLHSHQLVIPLDTHVGQICQLIGLTHRKSLNWKAAVEITEKLKQVDPKDPVRHDFALARLGILDKCRKRDVPEICSRCQLEPACRYRRKRKLRARY
jgi:uncharacterized protein (TIGR02757 family)